MKRIYVLLSLLALGAGLLSIAYAGGKNNIPPVHKDIAVVMPGLTIWAIVSREYPDRDPRDMVDKVCEINGIVDPRNLQVGTELILP